MNIFHIHVVVSKVHTHRERRGKSSYYVVISRVDKGLEFRV